MVEIDPIAIVAIIVSIVLGIPFLIVSFCVIRRLNELHRERGKFEGELFISDGGEMFSEFYIPVNDMTKKNYILLKVTKVNTNSKEVKDNGNI